MLTLSLSLSDSMRTFIEQKVAQGGYGTASEYIQQLLRDDQKRSTPQERQETPATEHPESGS
jgi:antitoxin ParD1/3/4